jgi:hypothetical protein
MVFSLPDEGLGREVALSGAVLCGAGFTTGRPSKEPGPPASRRKVEERGVVRQPQAGNPLVELADLEPAEVGHVPEAPAGTPPNL